MTSVSGTSQQLGFVVQNAAGAPFHFHTKERFKEIERRCEELAGSGAADVFLMSETFPVKRIDDFITAAWRRFGGQAFRATSRENDKTWKPKFSGSGLTTLTDRDVTVRGGPEFMPFEDGIFTDQLANKGVLLTRILLANGHEVDFYNVHLQAEWFGAKQIRLQQLAELKNFIAGSSAPENTVVVCGDLNFSQFKLWDLVEGKKPRDWQTGDEYRAMVVPANDPARIVDDVDSARDDPARLRFLDYVQLVHPGKLENILPTHDMPFGLGKKNVPGVRVDHILVLPGRGASIDIEKSTLAATRLSEQRKVSDHKALIASMNLKFE